MERHSRKYSAQVHEEACEWFVELRSDAQGYAVRQGFQRWLRESPAHMAAYLDVSEDWNRSGGAHLLEHWPKELLIEQGKHEITDVVIAHPVLRSEIQSASTERERNVERCPPLRKALQRLAVAACCLVLAVIGAVQIGVRFGETYSTGVGEQRSIVLQDGSTMDLNSRTRARVRFTHDTRGIELLQGQAFFKVAKKPSRPFAVRVDGMRVLAVGTEFDVYRKRSGVVVTVVEGKVVVAAADSSPSKALSSEMEPILFAGQRLTVTPHGSRIEQAEIDAALAWMRRQLLFDSTPLSEVVEEFNRYNERQLVIRDASLDLLQIDGVFSSTDPASLVRFLRSRPDVRVVETGQQVEIAHN